MQGDAVTQLLHHQELRGAAGRAHTGDGADGLIVHEPLTHWVGIFTACTHNALPHPKQLLFRLCVGACAVCLREDKGWVHTLPHTLALAPPRVLVWHAIFHAPET